MRYHLIWPFIKWMLTGSFSGVSALNKKYRREMEQHPGLAIFIGTICSILFIAVTTIVGVVIFNGVYVKYTFIASFIIAVYYVVYTFFSVMFNKFLDERKELFETIKR